MARLQCERWNRRPHSLGWRLRPGCLFFSIAITVGSALCDSPVTAQDVLPLPEAVEETRTLGTNELPRSVWMAVLAQGHGIRVLAGGGDPVFRAGDPRPVGVIRTVGPDGLTLTLTEGGTVRVPPGQSIPGARDLLFQEAARVQTVEYRHRVVDRGIPKVLGGELYLVGVRGTRAILQRDTERAMPPIHSPTALLEKRLAAIPIVSVGPGIWEVAAEDVRAAMQSGEAIIAYALQESRLQLSPSVGIGLEVRTPLADVRLERRGFVITSPNLARRAGLEVGDRILSVNDVPIDGFGTLVQAYRRIKSDPSIRVVQLLVERDEKSLFLTYRVR